MSWWHATLAGAACDGFRGHSGRASPWQNKRSWIGNQDGRNCTTMGVTRATGRLIRDPWLGEGPSGILALGYK